jgi:glutamyl-tRNA reductase
LPLVRGMSGLTVGRALRKHFDAVRRAEIARLDKKLRGLSDDERRSVEAITADVIEAIACVPARALAADSQQPALAAIVRLFALEQDSAV